MTFAIRNIVVVKRESFEAKEVKRWYNYLTTWASGEMANTLALGASARKSLGVQVLSRPLVKLVVIKSP